MYDQNLNNRILQTLSVLYYTGIGVILEKVKKYDCNIRKIVVELNYI